MTWFRKLYDKVIVWSGHRHANYYLAALSFAESSFFPVPPDVMLIPMGLARPSRAWNLALLTTLSSVAGGIVGYLLGVFFIELIYPWLVYFGHLDAFNTVQNWFQTWGFWAVLLAGITPIPYKLFTISAGAMQMPLLPFIVASILGRALRFFSISAALYFGGERIHIFLTYHIDKLMWGLGGSVLMLLLCFELIKLL